MKWRNPAEQGSTDNKTDDWVKFFFFFGVALRNQALTNQQEKGRPCAYSQI